MGASVRVFTSTATLYFLDKLIRMGDRNGSSDVSALPLPCPQSGTSSYSEDCLSMVLYVPVTLKASDGVPVFMWLVNISVVPVFE